MSLRCCKMLLGVALLSSTAVAIDVLDVGQAASGRKKALPHSIAHLAYRVPVLG